MLLTRARRAQANSSEGTPYGMDHESWVDDAQRLDTRDPADGARYRDYLREEVRWLDLELLLRGVEELEAQTLVLSAPIHGAFFDAQGLTREDRDYYYERVESLARAHGVQAALFADHDEDTEFSIDPFGHPSPVGWVYFDRALDTFFHGRADGEIP